MTDKQLHRRSASIRCDPSFCQPGVMPPLLMSPLPSLVAQVARASTKVQALWFNVFFVFAIGKIVASRTWTCSFSKLVQGLYLNEVLLHFFPFLFSHWSFETL